MKKFICLFLTLIPSLALGAPTVSGVSGTVATGQSITISGSSFGTKSPAAPVKWTSFEEGVNGDRLYAHDNTWCTFTGGGEATCGAGSGNKQGMTYSSNSPASGSLHVSNHLRSDEGFETNFYRLTTPSDELYVTHKWKYRDYEGESGVIKFTRLNSSTIAGGGGVYNGVGKTVSEAVGTLPATGTNHYFDAGSGDVVMSGGLTGCNLNTSWHRIHYYKKLSSPAGTANGVVGIWVDGQGSSYRTSQTTRNSGQTFQMDTVLLGTMDGAAAPGDYYIDVDDVYIDNTLSRVEICSGSTWANRGTCEVQIPSAWSASSVTATIRQGAFANSSTNYLYVVDSVGDANSNGYQVTFGAGSSPSGSLRPGVSASGVTFR